MMHLNPGTCVDPVERAMSRVGSHGKSIVGRKTFEILQSNK
jgi:hypothetical protein